MKNSLPSYNTFGFREIWIDNFFNMGFNKAIENLGSKQIPALKLWLKHSLLVNNDYSVSEFAINIKMLSTDSRFILILVHLYYYSNLIKLITDSCCLGVAYPREELIRNYMQDMKLKKRTIQNSLSSFFQTIRWFRSINKINPYTLELCGNRAVSFTRNRIKGIKYLHILYLLYFIHEQEGRSVFPLDYYPQERGRCSVKKLFGTSGDEVYGIITQQKELNEKYIKSINELELEIWPDMSALSVLGDIIAMGDKDGELF